MAITQITNDVQVKTSDFVSKIQQLEQENVELKKSVKDLLELQDGPCSEQTILKEHIRLLEHRVKELVSQNMKLVERLARDEETMIKAGGTFTTDDGQADVEDNTDGGQKQRSRSRSKSPIVTFKND